MEPMGAEGQWTSLSGVHTAEEEDFMALLLSNYSVPYHLNGTLPSLWPGHESTMNMAGNYGGSHCSLEISNSSLYSFSRGSSYSGGNSTNDQFYISDSHEPISVEKNYLVNIEGDDCLNNREIIDGSLEANVSKSTMEDKISIPTDENSLKRPRSSENVKVEKRYVKAKKKQKLEVSTNLNPKEEGGNMNGGANEQSSSSCSSEDDNSINASSCLSPKGPSVLNSDGKTRAQRGSATDPQSLYARKRRERINERLRILQSLVPNGTKVDISTMLEEAVLYVKFLQLQIKLLSSNELWMYAPIAYNGKDIGLDHLKLTMMTKQS